MEKKLMPIGIVLAAFGHPMYGHYAYNLAVASKLKSPEIPITLVKSGGSLNMLEPYMKDVFDNIIEAKSEWITGVHGTDYMKFKLHLNEISPYEKTLFLDVDMQWCPDASPYLLMMSLQGKTFEIANRGMKPTVDAEPSKYDWLPLSEIHSVYKIESVCDVSSEVIYFESNETSDKIFENAQKVYSENKLSVRNFSHAKPDEPYLMVGMALANHTPTIAPFEPSFWQGKYFTDIKREDYVYSFALISAGGDVNHPNTKRIYNNLTGMYFNQAGIKHLPYQVQSKINILKERKPQHA